MSTHWIIENLRRRGFTVKELTEYQLRVNDEFDVFLNDRSRYIKFHDIVTGERGKLTDNSMLFKVIERFAAPRECSEHQFVRNLVGIGWTEREARAAWKERHPDEDKASATTVAPAGRATAREGQAS